MPRKNEIQEVKSQVEFTKSQWRTRSRIECTEADFTQNEGKLTCSSFQSIYTSFFLTNEISLKGVDEKKSRIINFKGKTNRIEQEGRG
jgi:hypothetical protein